MTLIEKLEAATSGSRELSGLAMLEIGWTRSSDGLNAWISPKGEQYHVLFLGLDLTESMDAALTLHNADKWAFTLHHTDKIHHPTKHPTKHWIVYLDGKFGDDLMIASDAPTPALAICIAELKARVI